MYFQAYTLFLLISSLFLLFLSLFVPLLFVFLIVNLCNQIQYIVIAGNFYCWLQSCIAYSFCCWGMWDCWADAADWLEDKKTYEKESSFREEWCYCGVPHSGAFCLLLRISLVWRILLLLFLNSACMPIFFMSSARRVSFSVLKRVLPVDSFTNIKVSKDTNKFFYQ